MWVADSKRLMLTWPWVTMELNTPPIHVVEVSDASSGIKA